MFYSHHFLARKSPLGIVWCAAHLQHKLKKAQFLSTQVSTTAEQIMDPPVPIALRISGHLLLGVVRIYSKQVEYLYEECNGMRITINRVFTIRTESVNLPEDEDATLAKYQSVTLPENFDLDAVELDDYDKGWDWQNDLHRRSQVDITLEEQIPTGKDPYIVISFEEHQTTLPNTENLGSGPVPMEEDIPAVEVDTAADFQTSPSTRARTNDRNVGASSPQELPSIEIMRDAIHGFDLHNSPILPNRAEPDKFLEEQIIKDNETYTQHPEEVPLPGGSVSSPRAHENPPSVRILDSPMLFGHQSTELQMQPSPPPIARPQVRRKRKFFDENVVLSNQVIQRGLNDTSNIRRVRKNCPGSFLSIWKRNVKMRLMKDDYFVQPFVSGSCDDLQDIYKEDAVSVKFPPVSADEQGQETGAGEPSGTRPGDEEEIEVLRNNEYASPDRHMPDIPAVLPSPSERGYSTPLNSNVALQSEHMEATEGDEVLPTAGTRASSGMPDSEIRTPDTFYGMGLQGDHTTLSDIPELAASPGELGFLEQDSPAGNYARSPESVPTRKEEETSNQKAWSSRTREVAQYLKRQSSATPVSGSAAAESSEDLSLNKILEGKTRKICARMFYETLVLKSNDFIDVQQEEPYGDITLKMTSRLFEENFSS